MKTCFLLSWLVALNFRNFYKLVWINLDQIWRSYGRNKKTEKEKKEKKKKKKKNMKRAAGNTSSPALKPAHGPSQSQTQKGIFSLSLPPTRGPHLVDPSSSLWQPWPARQLLPPLEEILPEHDVLLLRSIRPNPKPPSQARPSINSLGPPLSSPFVSPRNHRLATEQFIVGTPPICRPPRWNSSPSMSRSSPSPFYSLYLNLARLPDHLSPSIS
jgi:hypothetical protein